MSGGTNQMKPRGTGMPQGFTNKPGGMAGMALQDYHNPTTGQTYTHPNTGANPGEGWMAGKPPPGQEYAQWQDPNAPPRQPGGGWNPGMAGQWGGGFAPPQQGGQTRVSPGFPSQWGQPGGLIGGGQQPQRRFPGMNIPGLLQYNQIDN